MRGKRKSRKAMLLSVKIPMSTDKPAWTLNNEIYKQIKCKFEKDIRLNKKTPLTKLTQKVSANMI